MFCGLGLFSSPVVAIHRTVLLLGARGCLFSCVTQHCLCVLLMLGLTCLKVPSDVHARVRNPPDIGPGCRPKHFFCPWPSFFLLGLRPSGSVLVLDDGAIESSPH